MLRSLSRQLLVSVMRQRWYCTVTDGETRLANILKVKFPGAVEIKVDDISGGCGAMYEVHIVADEFKGKRTVMQHRMVNEALAEEVKQMHGIRINTQPTQEKADS
ncbi:bolA-like protein 3 [Branchiostoma floridae]|uniref:BolA-like protein 3 n=2 Tax=Branchiostoma floridae TaxID=7739 RepID=A0A9J7LCM6_BRAFL|nr:bolA-like protein 3 [Branchiostoma floridae]